MLRYAAGLRSQQAPWRISSPGDAAEREADVMAERALSNATPTVPSAEAAGVQRQATSSSAPGAPASAFAPGLGVGRPLDPQSRAYFEPRFGANFSGVRIHDDQVAHRAADGLSAKAFTVGQNIAFARGLHAPDTEEGRRLLAHELAHVVQQSAGAQLAIHRKANDGSERHLDANALAQKAIEEIDGDKSYKVLIQVILVARNNHAVPALADALRKRPHPIHGNYLDAVVRTIQTEGNKELRSLVVSELLGKEGVTFAISEKVVKMTTTEKLKAAARLGVSASELGEEVIEELVDALPWIAGFYVASHFVGIGELADLLGIAFLGKAGVDAVRELSNYYELSRDAQNEGDLRAAGADLSAALAILGVTALLTLIAAVRRKGGAEKEGKNGEKDAIRSGLSTTARKALQAAANDAGPTVRVVTRLAEPPAAGRALSVATGFESEALAAEAGRTRNLYAAEIPRRFIIECERLQLVRRSITAMGEVAGVEYRFVAPATEFIVGLFKPVGKP